MSVAKYMVFSKVAELGSITKAAEALGYTQPAVSQIISSLEKRFGFSIINRGRDYCVLTENGKKLLYYCNQIIKNEEMLADTVHSLNGLLTGSLRIGSLSSMLTNFVTNVIFNYATSYSNVNINLTELTFTDIIAQLKDGTIDVGFTSSLASDKIKFIPLFNDPVRFIIPKDHPFNAYDKIPVKLLNGADFIMPSAGYDDVYKAITYKVSVTPNIKYQIGSDVAVAGLVANHLGISVMSDQQAKVLCNSVVVKEFCEDFHRTLGIAINAQYHLSPAARSFIQTASSLIKSGMMQGSSC